VKGKKERVSLLGREPLSEKKILFGGKNGLPIPRPRREEETLREQRGRGGLEVGKKKAVDDTQRKKLSAESTSIKRDTASSQPRIENGAFTGGKSFSRGTASQIRKPKARKKRYSSRISVRRKTFPPRLRK